MSRRARTHVGLIDPALIEEKYVGDESIYDLGPQQQFICGISPTSILRLVEHGWARTRQEADFLRQVADHGSVAAAAAAIGIARSTGYTWFKAAYNSITTAKSPSGPGVRATVESGTAWPPLRRGPRRKNLVGRLRRAQRVQVLLHAQQMELNFFVGGAS